MHCNCLIPSLTGILGKINVIATLPIRALLPACWTDRAVYGNLRVTGITTQLGDAVLEVALFCYLHRF